MKNSGKCVKIGKYKNFCRVRKEAFVTMTEQGKVHYLLVRGYEEFHDEDEWLGIYSTWENAIAAYEREHAALEREKARDLETFGERAMQLAMREEIQIHSFEETTGRWQYHLQSKENLQKRKTES